jgi:hypothetical protein
MRIELKSPIDNIFILDIEDWTIRIQSFYSHFEGGEADLMIEGTARFEVAEKYLLSEGITQDQIDLIYDDGAL